MKRKEYDEYTCGELLGNVKKVLFSEQETINQTIVEKENLLFEFNKDGDVVEQVSFFSNGEIKEKKRNVYENGNLKESLYLTPQNQIKQSIKYEYDANNKISGIVHLDSEGVIKIKEKFIRNNKQKLIYTQERGGECVLQIDYELDAKERVLKRIHYNNKGCVVGRYECEYTSKGEKRSEVHHNIENPLFTIREMYYYFYDENGTIKQKNTLRNSLGEKTMQILSYNTQGNIVRDELQILDTDNYTGEEFVREVFVTKKKYDNRNNLVEENTTTATNTYVYKYDTVGNWIEKKEYQMLAGIPKLQTTKSRQIEYFD